MGIRYSDSSLEHYNNQSTAQEQAHPEDNFGPHGLEALARAVVDRDSETFMRLSEHYDADLNDMRQIRAILSQVRLVRTARQVYPSGKV